MDIWKLTWFTRLGGFSTRLFKYFVGKDYCLLQFTNPFLHFTFYSLLYYWVTPLLKHRWKCIWIVLLLLVRKESKSMTQKLALRSLWSLVTIYYGSLVLLIIKKLSVRLFRTYTFVWRLQLPLLREMLWILMVNNCIQIGL